MTHAHHSSHDHRHDSTRRLRVAFFLNLAFTVVEIVGGLLTNSLAIVSDALHDLGDTFSIGLSWFLERQADRGKRGAYSYGFRRLSLLAALINALVLVVGSVWILAHAIPRLWQPQAVYAPGMLGLAVLGIVVNGAAVLQLRGGKTMNARIIAWHLLEDVLGWAAIFLVSLVLLFADIPILDPILSIVITCYVLYNVVVQLRRTMSIFLQAAPAELDLAVIERELGNIANVLSTHHTHAWSLDGEHHVLTTHLVVPASTTRAEVLQVKSDVLRYLQELQLEHTTIEIEYEDENCRMRET